MYQNMEHKEIFEAVERAWHKIEACDFEIKLPPKESMMTLLNIILENNEFEFNGQLYRQKIGLPMGNPANPTLTDIRMFEIITNIINQFPHREQILHLSIYRDDGFIIFSGNKENLTDFFNIANSIHPLLKFTYEISTDCLQFLDVSVYKGHRFENENILD